MRNTLSLAVKKELDLDLLSYNSHTNNADCFACFKGPD